MKVYRPIPDGVIPDYSHTIPVVMPDSLQQLQGPTTGTVTLPIRLDWTPSNSYDLSDPGRLRTMYTTVLREAHREADLCEFLDAETLRRHWPQLRLPVFTRSTWETRFPALTQHQAAA